MENNISFQEEQGQVIAIGENSTATGPTIEKATDAILAKKESN